MIDCTLNRLHWVRLQPQLKFGQRPDRSTVLTLGAFDGVHLGHQQLLKTIKHTAEKQNLATAVLLFEPQPKEFFSKNLPDDRIDLLRDKLYWLQQWGIDYVGIIGFNQAVAAITAERFVEDYLLKQARAKVMFIGDDFRFGYQRQGDFKLLQSLAEKHKFEVSAAETYQYKGQRVSSSRVRAALKQNDFATANALLGHAYCISGRVIYGDQIGRTFGFRTANIALNKPVTLEGIYATWVTGLTPSPLAAVTYIGKRPAINGTQTVCETHILEYAKDCYGMRIRVEFLHCIRGDQNFDSEDALVQQISKDCDNARAYFDQLR